MPVRLPFDNRYRHWVKGFLIEVGAFTAFILFVVGISVAAALVFG